MLMVLLGTKFELMQFKTAMHSLRSMEGLICKPTLTDPNGGRSATPVTCFLCGLAVDKAPLKPDLLNCFRK